MSTEVAERQGTAVANPETMADAFAQYGAEATAGMLPFLLFKKGDWTLGQEDKAVADGTEFVADMGSAKVGWVRWQGKRPTDMTMSLIAAGERVPLRGSLGDQDQATWEVGNDGRPQDPWQLTNTIELCNPEDPDDRVLFTTSSSGGRQAVGNLCKEYGSHMRFAPDELPVIALGSDSYKHTTYGKVHVPTLEVVAWVDRDGQQVEAEDKNARVVDGPEPPPAPEPAARPKASSRSSAKTRF